MKGLSNDIRGIVLGTLVMAAVSAFADAFWAAALPEHRAVYGLVHGGLLFGVFGLVLAWMVGAARLLPWGATGIVVGALAAVVFYALFPFVGTFAMLVAWMALWLAFAQIAERAAASPEGGARPVVRGVLAAVLSGVGFWAISGIWLGPHDPGLLYWRNFLAWCVAFGPGFLALLGGRAETPGR